jgi:hypothetical protein
MLFYGKEIDIFYIILLVIFILVVYILISYYMQKKQSIAITTSSRPIISTTSTINNVPIKFNKYTKETLNRGAFAISLWLNISSWVLPTTSNANFNILTMNNTPSNQIFRLYIDKTCNLSINSTFFKNEDNYKTIGDYRITGGGDNNGNNVNIGSGNSMFQVSDTGNRFNNGKTLTYTIPSGSYDADTLTKMIQNVMNSAGEWTAITANPDACPPIAAIPAAPPNFYIDKIDDNNYEFGFNYMPSSYGASSNLTITLVGNKDGVPFNSRLIFGATSSQTTFQIYKKLPRPPEPAVPYKFTPIVNGNATSVLPINEPVNVILNYNGDDDYNEDKNQFFTAKDGTITPMYNTNTGFAYKNRALDVFINGRLNNTIILNTSLTRNDKGTPNCDTRCVSYNDASMNYIIDDNVEVLIGSVGSVPITGPVGTISNVAFIKGGCTIEDAQSINNRGNSSNILDDLFSYKLQFSLLEDDKKVKVYELF